jgi:hypothetical protein
MPCFLVVLALVTPRLVVALLWFSTRWFEGIFSSLLWLLAGFIFLLAIDFAPARGYRRRRA